MNILINSWASNPKLTAPMLDFAGISALTLNLSLKSSKDATNLHNILSQTRGSTQKRSWSSENCIFCYTLDGIKLHGVKKWWYWMDWHSYIVCFTVTSITWILTQYYTKFLPVEINRGVYERILLGDRLFHLVWVGTALWVVIRKFS